MGNTPTRYGRAFIVIVAAAFFAFTNYSCRQTPSPVSNTNSNAGMGAPAPTAAQLVIPPWPQGFPPSVPTASVSGNIPLAVPLPSQINSPVQIRPNFDYFSWESFIALNWPAAPGSRGTPNQPGNPDVFLKAAPGTPVVWGTYKDSNELFGQKDQRPTPWNSPDIPINPCPNGQAGQKTLIFLSKGNTPLMQTSQAFSFPLIDQRGNYVYYDIRYDEAQYNFIRGQDNDSTSWLYLLKNLSPAENKQDGLQMPMSTTTPTNALGSIMVKAAWRIQTPKDDPGRYYAITAQIFDPQTKTCTQTPVLLVGLHIAHKVAPFTQWVWSTFEHVDNVPPDAGVTTPPPPNGYSFNNGTDNPKTVNGYDYKPPQAPSVQPNAQPSATPLVPVQVTRVNPIPDTPQGASTRDINAFYQQILKGTVWQYYQLVVTQWPFQPGLDNFTLMQNGGVYPQDAGAAFPVNGAVNTTMETYFQAQNDAAGAGGNSCMSCHYRAGQSDFSWGLNRRAH
jgi:hypothetical protein